MTNDVKIEALVDFILDNRSEEEFSLDVCVAILDGMEADSTPATDVGEKLPKAFQAGRRIAAGGDMAEVLTEYFDGLMFQAATIQLLQPANEVMETSENRIIIHSTHLRTVLQ